MLDCRKVRSKKGTKCFFCIKKREFFKECSYCDGCDEKEYKNLTPLRKKSSSKRTKAVSISSNVKKKVYERDGGCCIFCGMQGLPEAHVVPRSKGGRGIEQNIVTVCRFCHYKMDQTNHREEMIAKAEEYLESIYSSEDLSVVIYRKELGLC